MTCICTWNSNLAFKFETRKLAKITTLQCGGRFNGKKSFLRGRKTPRMTCGDSNVSTYISIYALSFYRSQMFCAGPKIYLHIVPVTNILCQTKRWFALSKISFCTGTKVFWRGFKCSQIFGLVKNIWTGTKHLGPVKGQGIVYFDPISFFKDCS